MLTSVLYRLYERRLRAELQREPLPHHIDLILDGNRRFARQLASPRRDWSGSWNTGCVRP